jgi:hypothetical protein
MGVAMVAYQNRLCHYDVPLNVNTVFGGYQTPVTDLGVVVKHDNRFPILVRRGKDGENGILQDLD